MRKVARGGRLGCSTLAIGAAAGLVGVRFAGDLSDFRIGVDFRAPTVGGLMPTSSCPNAVCPMMTRANNITRRDATMCAVMILLEVLTDCAMRVLIIPHLLWLST